MSNEFTAESLPKAIRSLFELNNYEVSGPLEIHGAEVDLVAKSRTDPFAQAIYIEATIEYVNNDKYGKDIGKLALIREKQPDAQCLIVSSAGFSLPVKERAANTRIQTYTYSELFVKFERFEAYVRLCLDGHLAGELSKLASIYEEPNFNDASGLEKATEYLTKWRDSSDLEKRWLVVVGEYGTGKTALTKVLQHRWTTNHRANPELPIPFRIELRDFTHQFNGRALLHHFLDNNDLGHVPIEFVYSLIRKGRVVLLLDGYDEMAQYMHARERRACLEALSHLAADGAKGLLTSRPNYFSEAEEFRVFEALYASLKINPTHIGHQIKAIADEEQRIDELLKTHIVDRYERSLQDLNPKQTEALISRLLKDDPEGQKVVLGIMRRVFRPEPGGTSVSLSGKPVIISYLIEVIEGLKKSGTSNNEPLSEWQVYKLIVDHLMIRDWRQRSQQILPDRRRDFLRKLSLCLTGRKTPIIADEQLKEMIRQDFKSELRLKPEEEREQELEQYLLDIRSSGTLTKATEGGNAVKFSHNSLREFLLTELLIDELAHERVHPETIPISEAMRLFVKSQTDSEIHSLLEKLANLWPNRISYRRIGQLLSLVWDGALRILESEADPTGTCLVLITGKPVALNGVTLTRISVSSPKKPASLVGASFSEGELFDCDLSNANLQNADFRGVIVENSRFCNADLSGADFRESLLLDADFSKASVQGTDFRSLSTSPVIWVSDAAPGSRRRIEGEAALGYLRYLGAKTDNVGDFFVYQYHPKFSIVEKICRKLTEQNWRQRLGLTQKGVASQDTSFANDFMSFLESSKLVETNASRRTLVRGTQVGREVFVRLCEHSELGAELAQFLHNNRE